MVYQIVNGRGKNGYEQVALGPRLPFSEEEKEQLASGFCSYKGVGSRMAGGSLPECFYYYHMMTQEGDAAVVGKTSYVKALASLLSGRRDTSISHKYIFTKEDEEQLVGNSELLFKVQTFCSVMEEKEQLNKEDIFTAYSPEHSFFEVLEHFRLKNCFSSFLYAVVNSCYIKRCRTYIYGLTDTKKDSDFAKELMYYVMQGMPVCWRRAIGFVTYSCGILEPGSNPMPHGVNVVFLGTMSSKKAFSEREKQNYYFNMPTGEGFIMPNFKQDKESEVFFDEIAAGYFDPSKKGLLSTFLEKNGGEFKAMDAEIPFVMISFSFYQLLGQLRDGEDLKRNQEETEKIFMEFLSYSPCFSKYMRSITIYFFRNYLKSFLQKRDGLHEHEWKLMQNALLNAKFLKKEIVDILARRFLKRTAESDAELKELLNQEYLYELKEAMLSSLYEENKWNELGAHCFEEEVRKEIRGKETTKSRIEYLIRALKRMYVKNRTFAGCSFMIETTDRLIDESLKTKSRVSCEELHYLYEELTQIEKNFSLRNVYRNIRKKYIADRIPIGEQLEELDESELESLSVFTRNELCDLCQEEGRMLYLGLLSKKIQKAVKEEPVEELVFHVQQLSRADFNDIAARVDFMQEEYLKASITVPESDKYMYYRYLLLTGYDVMALLKHVLYADSIKVIYHLLQKIEQMCEDGELILNESSLFYIRFTSDCLTRVFKRFKEKYHLSEKEIE